MGEHGLQGYHLRDEWGRSETERCMWVGGWERHKPPTSHRPRNALLSACATAARRARNGAAVTTTRAAAISDGAPRRWPRRWWARGALRRREAAAHGARRTSGEPTWPLRRRRRPRRNVAACGAGTSAVPVPNFIASGSGGERGPPRRRGALPPRVEARAAAPPALESASRRRLKSPVDAPVLKAPAGVKGTLAAPPPGAAASFRSPAAGRQTPGDNGECPASSPPRYLHTVSPKLLALSRAR